MLRDGVSAIVKICVIVSKGNGLGTYLIGGGIQKGVRDSDEEGSKSYCRPAFISSLESLVGEEQHFLGKPKYNELFHEVKK